jgi:putative FmdB family regulatory protein
MPTYHYVCTKCDHEFEHVQSIKAAPLQTCPKEKCGQKKWGRGRVKRALSGGAGLLFKGSGFYITDYAGKKSKEKAKDSAPAKEVKGGDGKPAADAKPPADSSPYKTSTKTS